MHVQQNPTTPPQKVGNLLNFSMTADIPKQFILVIDIRPYKQYSVLRKFRLLRSMRIDGGIGAWKVCHLNLTNLKPKTKAPTRTSSTIRTKMFPSLRIRFQVGKD